MKTTDSFNYPSMIPRIAIIDQNTLEATGLKSIICDIVPKVDVSTFPSLDAMLSEVECLDHVPAVSAMVQPIPFVHFFVSSQILIANADFFLARPQQTIVLTTHPIASKQFSSFHTLDTSQMERDLIKAILRLHQYAHGCSGPQGFRHGIVPETEIMTPATDISPRETEVLALIVRGFLNKEIADHLCISLPTVISHRKNICEKLHLRSVSSLTIYAVTHGIVSAEDI